MPGTIDETLDYLMENYPINIPIADLLYSDIFTIAKENLLSAVYLGERTIEGDVLDHLSFESTGADWQLWVQHGDRPVPRRLLITFVNTPGEPEYLTIIPEWDFDPKVDDAAFQFAPPKDWERFEIAKNPPPAP